jgi:hypothetical protein
MRKLRMQNARATTFEVIVDTERQKQITVLTKQKNFYFVALLIECRVIKLPAR